MFLAILYFTRNKKYITVIKAVIAVIANVNDELKLYHNKPAMVLASIVQILWKAVNVPIAVAVSFLSATLLIHALLIPSVAAA